MNRITDKIHEMGLKLPKPFVYPSPNRTGCVVTGKLVYTSGHPPPSGFGVTVHGKVGGDISEQEAVSSAQAAALNILASVEKTSRFFGRYQTSCESNRISKFCAGIRKTICCY